MLSDQIAVLADIHGNSLALEAVLNDIRERGIKTILDLGDSLYGPLDPSGTARLLIENKLSSIRGNQDNLILHPREKNPTLDFVLENLNSTQLNWLEKVPPTKIKNDFFLCHGSPTKSDEYLIEEVLQQGVFLRESRDLSRKLKSIEQQIILCAHSHLPHIIYLLNGKIIVNPGSVGLQAYTDNVPYPHKMETGSPHARYCIVSKRNEGWVFEIITLPYDWKTAALMAEKNNRTDWAKWLRTGRAI
ncbi:MAG: metallophosphoesterase family protein [Candidatus Kariarchaeaceae archaeon]|jgi:predicted phosphodiesterase